GVPVTPPITPSSELYASLSHGVRMLSSSLTVPCTATCVTVPAEACETNPVSCTPETLDISASTRAQLYSKPLRRGSPRDVPLHAPKSSPRLFSAGESCPRSSASSSSQFSVVAAYAVPPPMFDSARYSSVLLSPSAPHETNAAGTFGCRILLYSVPLSSLYARR